MTLNELRDRIHNEIKYDDASDFRLIGETGAELCGVQVNIEERIIFLTVD